MPGGQATKNELFFAASPIWRAEMLNKILSIALSHLILYLEMNMTTYPPALQYPGYAV